MYPRAHRTSTFIGRGRPIWHVPFGMGHVSFGMGGTGGPRKETGPVHKAPWQFPRSNVRFGLFPRRRVKKNFFPPQRLTYSWIRYPFQSCFPTSDPT